MVGSNSNMKELGFLFHGSVLAKVQRNPFLLQQELKKQDQKAFRSIFQPFKWRLKLCWNRENLNRGLE